MNIMDYSVTLIAFGVAAFAVWGIWDEMFRIKRNTISGEDLVNNYVKWEQLKIKRGERNV